MAHFDDLPTEAIRQIIRDLYRSRDTRHIVFDVMRSSRRLRDTVIEFVLKTDTSPWTDKEYQAGLQQMKRLEKTVVRNQVRALKKKKANILLEIAEKRRNAHRTLDPESGALWVNGQQQQALILQDRMRTLRKPFAVQWKKQEVKRLFSLDQAKTVQHIGDTLRQIVVLNGT